MILNVNLPPLKNVPKPTQRELDLHELANMVAEKHHLTGYELKMKSRSQILVDARADFAKNSIKEYTQKEIANYLGIDRSTVAHYLKGHKGGPIKNTGSRHGRAKLVESDIPIIKRMYESGLSQEKISDIFHVTGPTISNIVNQKTWGHV